jgi:hypothetical protein
MIASNISQIKKPTKLEIFFMGSQMDCLLHSSILFYFCDYSSLFIVFNNINFLSFSSKLLFLFWVNANNIKKMIK